MTSIYLLDPKYAVRMQMLCQACHMVVDPVLSKMDLCRVTSPAFCATNSKRMLYTKKVNANSKPSISENLYFISVNIRNFPQLTTVPFRNTSVSYRTNIELTFYFSMSKKYTILFVFRHIDANFNHVFRNCWASNTNDRTCINFCQSSTDCSQP